MTAPHQPSTSEPLYRRIGRRILNQTVAVRTLVRASGLVVVSLVSASAGYTLIGDFTGLLKGAEHLGSLFAFLLLLSPLYLSRYFILQLQQDEAARRLPNAQWVRGAALLLIIVPASLAVLSALLTISVYQPAAFSFISSDLRDLSARFPSTTQLADSLGARLPDIAVHARHALASLLFAIALAASPAYVLYLFMASLLLHSERVYALRWRVLFPALFATALPFAYGASLAGATHTLPIAVVFLMLTSTLGFLLHSPRTLSIVSLISLTVLSISLPVMHRLGMGLVATSLEAALTAFLISGGMVVTAIWLMVLHDRLPRLQGDLATALLPIGLLVILFPSATPSVIWTHVALIAALLLVWFRWLRHARANLLTRSVCVGLGLLIPAAAVFENRSLSAAAIAVMLSKLGDAIQISLPFIFIVTCVAFWWATDRHHKPMTLEAFIWGPYDAFQHLYRCLLLSANIAMVMAGIGGIVLLVAFLIRATTSASTETLTILICRAGLMSMFAVLISIGLYAAAAWSAARDRRLESSTVS